MKPVELVGMGTDQMVTVAKLQQRLVEVWERINSAAERAGRSGTEVSLVIVTKGHPLETIEAAIAAGGRTFGENYPEEGVEKMHALAGVAGLSWHMIGHVQSRKTNLVSQYYDWLHSLDRTKIAERLDRQAGERNRKLPVLLECNVSGEPTKYGFPVWNEQQYPAFYEAVTRIVSCPYLEVRGLMTMAPYGPNPEEARPYFRKLARLRQMLEKKYPSVNWSELSMGMSDDFEVAVEEGATMVRIGTAILGPRPTS